MIAGDSGTGEGTYYFDARLSSCPGGESLESDTTPSCASNAPGPNAKTLMQLGSNNVIAIKALAGSPASDETRERYCGKQVIISVNGNQIQAPDGGDFFVWDGCETCSDETLDFTVSGLLAVNSDACTLGIVKGIQYQITNTQVQNFVA